MKVKAKKSMRYGNQFIEIGEIGEIIPLEDTPVAWLEPIYDFYISFKGQPAFGVFCDEVEMIKDENQSKG